MVRKENVTKASATEEVIEEINNAAQVVEEKPASEEKKIKLNLGCGFRHLGSPDQIQVINIDNRAEVSPDMVLDVTKGLPFDNNSIDEIFARDFLEHIPIGKVIPLVEEIYRVLKPGGKFESITPDCEVGQGAFQDPFHVSFWCQNSWLYYTDNDHRNLYGIKAKFSIETMNRLENKPMRIYYLHVIVRAIKD